MCSAWPMAGNVNSASAPSVRIAAIAVAVSSSSGSIAPCAAMMAVTPQMLDPIESSEVSFGGRWKTRPSSVMTLLGRVFHLPPKLTSLLSIGSSICGVTAIMAAQGAIEPDEEDTATAIAAILTLGALALFTFPAIGHALHMRQQSYGIWTGLA